MATITRTNANRLKTAFRNHEYENVPMTGNGEVSIMADLKFPAVIVKIAGLEFQVWGVNSVEVTNKDLRIHGESAPVYIPIRGA